VIYNIGSQSNSHYAENTMTLFDNNDKLISEYENSEFEYIGEEEEIFDVFKTNYDDYKKSIESIIELNKFGRYEEAALRYKESIESRDIAISNLHKIMDINQNSFKAIQNKNDKILKGSRHLVYLMSVISLIVTIVIAIYMARSVMILLKRVQRHAESLANYDLTEDIKNDRKDEFGDTIEAIKHIQENLKNLVGNIIGETQNLSASSQELSAITEEINAKFIEINESTSEIAQVTQDASAATEETNLSANAKEVLEFMDEKVMKDYEAFLTTLDDNVEDSDFVSGMSQGIASMAQEITATMTQLNQVVENISKNAEGSSENTASIVEGMNEMAQGTEQIAITASSQAELAENLNTMVSKFTI
jgi:methyl-accepting chemotaxis protein